VICILTREAATAAASSLEMGAAISLVVFLIAKEFWQCQVRTLGSTSSAVTRSCCYPPVHCVYGCVDGKSDAPPLAACPTDA